MTIQGFFFMPYVVYYSSWPLLCGSSHRQYINKGVWLYAKKTGLMDTEICIPCNFYIKGRKYYSFYLFFFFCDSSIFLLKAQELKHCGTCVLTYIQINEKNGNAKIW